MTAKSFEIVAHDKYGRMKKINGPSLCRIFWLLMIFTSFHCNKTFDQPPGYEDPQITVNATIADLKKLHSPGNIEFLTEEKIIAGIVIADDKSGNFYKSIVIQDESGGLSVKIDDFSLYTSYPIGRKVYVKTKGMYLGDYNGMIEIGGAIDNSGSRPVVAGVAAKLADQYIVKGSLNNQIVPKPVAVKDLNETFQNTLIVLERFEFSASDTSKTFADTTLTLSAVNYTINNCNGDKIILRNSSYSKFAGHNLPDGNGNIVAVYTVFGATKQLYIRDTSDIRFSGPRCAGGGSGNGEVVSIETIKKMHVGSDIVLDNLRLKGIVISNAIERNVAPGCIVLQDGNSGILISFGSSTDVTKFLDGDSLVINVSGGILMNDQGSMRIQLTAYALPVAPEATGKTVAPRTMTIAEINNAFPAIEYCLIRITNATASGNSTYGGNNLLADGTGTMVLFTRTGNNAATFANEPLPAGTADFTGFANVYNGLKEFQIRSLDDVVSNGVPPPPKQKDLLFSEYIEGSSYNKYLEIFNESDSAVVLSQYAISLYKNGSMDVSYTVKLDELTGLSALESHQFIILAHPRAALVLPPQIKSFPTNVCDFNGDDAITLEKNRILIDVFGEPGTDPGTGWTISGIKNASVDQTVRRSTAIKSGNTNWQAGSQNEWIVIKLKDDVSNLGVR